MWFFLQHRVEINEEIIRIRTQKSVSEYAQQCAEKVRNFSPRALMQGLGEVLLDNKSKNFARKELITETASGLDLFAAFPLIAAKKD